VNNSFVGVRTPSSITTPWAIGRTVFALLVNR
jgi:hypothetical protein